MAEKPSERVINVTRRVQLVEHTCPVCGQAFTGPSWQLYDKLACNKRAEYARHAEQRREARRAKYRRQKDAATSEPG